MLPATSPARVGIAAAPGPGDTDRLERIEGRLDRIEGRFDRVEEILEKILEGMNGKGEVGG